MTSGPNEAPESANTRSPAQKAYLTRRSQRRLLDAKYLSKSYLLKLLTWRRMTWLAEIIMQSFLKREEIWDDKELVTAMEVVAKNIGVPYGTTKMFPEQRALIEREGLQKQGVMPFDPTLENMMLLETAITLAAPEICPFVKKEIEAAETTAATVRRATRALIYVSGTMGVHLAHQNDKMVEFMKMNETPIKKSKMFETLPKSLSQFAKLFEKEVLPVPPLLKKVVDAMEETGQIQA